MTSYLQNLKRKFDIKRAFHRRNRSADIFLTGLENVQICQFGDERFVLSHQRLPERLYDMGFRAQVNDDFDVLPDYIKRLKLSVMYHKDFNIWLYLVDDKVQWEELTRVVRLIIRLQADVYNPYELLVETCGELNSYKNYLNAIKEENENDKAFTDLSRFVVGDLNTNRSAS